MEDYYAIMGLDRSASADQIDRAVREQLRIWQRRTAHADLGRRQAAERRVQLLSQARTTLLDAASRRRGSASVPRPGGPRSSGTWA